jgi:hippurate hydrolase
LCDLVEQWLKDIATCDDVALGASVEVKLDRITGLVANEPALIGFCSGAAVETFGPDNVKSAMEPLMGGDGFSRLANLRPAC